MSIKIQNLSVRQITWAITIAFFALFALLVFNNRLSPAWLILPIMIIVLVAYDTMQSKHAIRRNYPIIGQLRYLFESVRPEFRQYFFEGELDGKPFNRRQRSIVYQRAKNDKQTISFGMQDDPNRVGYEWVAHSIYPKHADYNNFRITIGNNQCKQPYNASILNIGAMSYGALSKTAITSLNKGAMKGGFAHNTGEGGVSEYHLQGADVIWQIGTGYFGCRNEDGTFSGELFAKNAEKPNIKMVEVKLSQGAKPGHGGLLPAEKNTPEIAAIRHIKPFTTVHSPSSHSAFNNAIEMLYFINNLKKLSNGKPVGFKICIGRQDEFIDIAKAMLETGIIPDFITIDGAEGGTGAAPLEFIDYMGMALSDALVFATKVLKEYGVRDQIKVLASGKVITAFDLAKALSLGADACYSARGMMFSLGCIQALRCDSGKCPVGIATQDRNLYKGIDITDKSERVANFHKNTMKALADFIGACGCETPKQINPKMFYKKTDKDINKSFAEIYFETKKDQEKSVRFN
ncbi:FMN-binding glutamate synthase family protein [Flavobacterium sp. '19STA2R22 D10 B1']|uniref:FMN-binding glutamate synthase family protein n=1 Tax=Flavobacterium aerium TaxID=3037261 RepID=UPI00278BD818|nr:FMN-binding glutamate synthase family protein [Flavobacterium sp. '19STA2R22 D10 B1']